MVDLSKAMLVYQRVITKNSQPMEDMVAHGLGSTDWWSRGPKNAGENHRFRRIFKATGYAKMFWAHRPTYNNLINHRLLRIWL